MQATEKEEEHHDHFCMEGRNVTLITTVKKWEEKLAEANKDGKIVSSFAFLLHSELIVL